MLEMSVHDLRSSTEAALTPVHKYETRRTALSADGVVSDCLIFKLMRDSLTGLHRKEGVEITLNAAARLIAHLQGNLSNDSPSPCDLSLHGFGLNNDNPAPKSKRKSKTAEQVGKPDEPLVQAVRDILTCLHSREGIEITLDSAAEIIAVYQRSVSSGSSTQRLRW